MSGVPAPVQGDIVRVQTVHGPMWVFAQDRYVSRSLIDYGEYAAGEAHLFGQLVQPGMTVVEAGANLGALSVMLARACAPGPFYAFEPQRRVFQVLCTNLTINGIVNAHAYPEGLGAATGMAHIPQTDYSNPGNFGSMELSAMAGQASDPVRVTALDDWNLPALHFLKLDVEGFEAEVLRGAQATLRRCRPAIFTENDREAHQAAIIALLDEAGYRLYWHVTPLYRRENFNNVPHNIFGETVALNMLALPREDPRPVQGLEPIDPKSWRSPVRPIGG